jgi:predicted dehydrogenase
MPVKYGVIGVGAIAQRRHIPECCANPDSQIAALADPVPGRAESVCSHYGGRAKCYADYKEMLRDPNVDAVVVAGPNSLHAQQSIEALQAGKHVLVEKPMARTLAEAEAMNTAAAASGRQLMVAHCWRFHEDVRALRARIAAGELGEITKTRGYGVHAGWGPSGWFTDLELAGGGALLDMGVHAIDTARFLLGDPALETVCARIATRHGDYAVDDDGLLLIGWANGTSSLVESGWWHAHLPGLEADTEVYGTAGYARIWDFTEGHEGYEHCAQPMYSAQVAEFIDALADGRQPHPSGEDGAVVMDVVDRAYRSAGIR